MGLTTILAFLQEGNLAIADNSNHRVQIVSPEGEFILAFGSLGHGNGEFQSPYALCIDNKNNIVVSDYGPFPCPLPPSCGT
jgi:tripartite motif-containing protein 2/3